MTEHKKEVKSIGIACCRISGGKTEILMVCKRYTYMYNIFIHGKYNSCSDEEIIKILNGTTIAEKYDINSMNFLQIWYRVYLNKPHKPSTFVMSKNKYESAFMIDGGARLRRLLSMSSNIGEIWEIPKGKKKNKSEPDIHCAIREFHEETRISKKNYKIYPATKTYAYVDAGVKYVNLYYFALLRKPVEIKISFGTKDQFEEICGIRWMSLNDIRLIDPERRLSAIVRPIFNYVRKHR